MMTTKGSAGPTMTYYTKVLRERVRHALTTLLAGAHRARDLAAVLRELATELHVPLPQELGTHAPKEGVDILRQRVRQALTSLLAVERMNWGRDLAMIFREIADELDPPALGDRE